MHILLLLLLGFALSVLAWWLLTDDDAVAPVDEPLPSVESEEPAEVAQSTVGRPRRRLAAFQRVGKAFGQVYFRAKAYFAVFRSRLLSTPTRGRK